MSTKKKMPRKCENAQPPTNISDIQDYGKNLRNRWFSGSWASVRAGRLAYQALSASPSSFNLCLPGSGHGTSHLRLKKAGTPVGVLYAAQLT